MAFDEAEMDMIRRGDMLGPKLGAKVATALETLQRERDEAAGRIIVLEAALFPFAAFADSVDQFVTDRARDGGSPIMPTKHFRLAHFKAARAALTKGE